MPVNNFSILLIFTASLTTIMTFFNGGAFWEEKTMVGKVKDLISKFWPVIFLIWGIYIMVT
jgi:hypothetical protein